MAPEPYEESELLAYGLTPEQVAAVAKLPEWLRNWLRWAMERWLGRVGLRIAASLQRIQIFDRSMTIAAQLFTSVFPIIIMGAAIFGADATSDVAADAIKLPGETAEVMEDVVSSGGIGTFGLIGILVVLVSATSLSRALTRAYDAVWQHGRTRTKATQAWRWLAAVFVLAVAVVLTRTLVAYLEPIPPHDFWSTAGYLAVQVAIASFIPWLLMAGRVQLRWLLPGAVLYAVVMVIAQPISAHFLPLALETSASRYGSIGVAFTYLTWLYIVSWVMLGCAVLGQVITTDEGSLGRFLRGRHTPSIPVPVAPEDDPE